VVLVLRGSAFQCSESLESGFDCGGDLFDGLVAVELRFDHVAAPPSTAHAASTARLAASFTAILLAWRRSTP